MKEAYVSYEVAKLLKEKGFDWELRTYYNEDGDELTLHDDFADMSNSEIDTCNKGYIDYLDIHCTRPTQQMAMRWLRERGIHIMPTIGCDVDRTPRIFYGAVIALFNDYGDIDYRDPLDEDGYDEPEDAIEAVLQYCLTNLI